MFLLVSIVNSSEIYVNIVLKNFSTYKSFNYYLSSLYSIALLVYIYLTVYLLVIS